MHHPSVGAANPLAVIVGLPRANGKVGFSLPIAGHGSVAKSRWVISVQPPPSVVMSQVTHIGVPHGGSISYSPSPTLKPSRRISQPQWLGLWRRQSPPVGWYPPPNTGIRCGYGFNLVFRVHGCIGFLGRYIFNQSTNFRCPSRRKKAKCRIEWYA